MRGEGVGASIEQSSENEGEQKPRRSCAVEAMVELMTVRLADLVKGKVKRWPWY